MEPYDLFRILASFADPDLWILNGPEFREWKPAKADTIQHHKPLIISETHAIHGSIRVSYPWGWELLSPELETRNSKRSYAPTGAPSRPPGKSSGSTLPRSGLCSVGASTSAGKAGGRGLLGGSFICPQAMRSLM